MFQRDDETASPAISQAASVGDGAKHTPTPWNYRRAKFPTDGEFDCGISAVIEGRPHCIAETFGRCATKIMPSAEANAAFIVKAVNAHETLTKRIARLEADLNECREFIEPYVDTVDSDDGPVPNRAMSLVCMIDETLNGSF